MCVCGGGGEGGGGGGKELPEEHLDPWLCDELLEVFQLLQSSLYSGQETVAD